MNTAPLSDSARKLRAFDLEFRKKARIRTHYGIPVSPEEERRRINAHNSRDPYIAPTHYGTPKPNTHRKES